MFFFWVHFEQIQGYASRCLLGSLCPLVYGAAEWFSNSGDVHDLHHAELCSRATAEILFFFACLSPPSRNQKNSKSNIGLYLGKSSINVGFSIAMFDYRRVVILKRIAYVFGSLF